MPHFAANLSMLWPELDVYDRFRAAAEAGSIADGGCLICVGDTAFGTLFRVVKRGRAELHVPHTSWCASVRVAPKSFVGLAKYRHLEDDE